MQKTMVYELNEMGQIFCIDFIHLVFFFFPNMILIKTEFVLLVLFRLDIEFTRYKLLKKLCILGGS
jgi:hypothetical protein